MARMVSITSFLLALSSFQTVHGNAFLKKTGPASKQMMNQTLVELRFLDEVRGFVGKGPVDVQLPVIKKALEPMWLALPKNEHGRLGTAQVRYALHRFFVQRHGWHIDGLNRDASEGTPAGILRERVPSFLMELFEEAFGKSGLMLHELAIFAATLERMIHDEATDRLRDVYKALSASTSEPLAEDEAQAILRAYMMSLIFGQQTLSSQAEVDTHIARLQRTYPGWEDTKAWLSDVQNTVAYLEQGSQNPFKTEQAAVMGFERMERVAQQVSERLGSFQDTDCRQLKDSLLEREEHDTGRVLLSDFYKIGMDGAMQFVEKPDYLRQLGVLDETKPGEPRVVVSNYVLSQGNCLADMGFYSICCINECESLMAQVEQKIAAPRASPQQLAAVVSGLSSSSVEASGELTPVQRKRLFQIAEINRGVVPLHGRLFAQWMHAVFPRECPMPSAGAVANPLSASEWLEATGEKTNYQRKEMQQYIETASKNAPAGSDAAEDSSSMHWSDEEEILYLPTEASKGLTPIFVRGTLLLVLVGVLAVAGVDKARRSQALTSVGIGKEKAHLV